MLKQMTYLQINHWDPSFYLCTTYQLPKSSCCNMEEFCGWSHSVFRVTFDFQIKKLSFL